MKNGMTKKLQTVIILLSLSFWPLNLFLANTLTDFLKYLVSSFLIGLSFVLFRLGFRRHFIPLFLIPFVEPKLTVLPLLVVLVDAIWQRSLKNFLWLGLSLAVLFVNWNGFWGQTIFTPDYENQRVVVGKTYLYPSILLARTFQNKPRIYWDKFTNNFFALTDPNNYFFGFHPREIVIDNQNLKKYPFLGLIFMLFGFYYLRNNPHVKFLIILLASSVLSLSILAIFDRNDFILWIPLSLVFVHGVRVFGNRQWKFKTLFYVVFLIFTMTEAIRILLR